MPYGIRPNLTISTHKQRKKLEMKKKKKRRENREIQAQFCKVFNLWCFKK